MVWLCQIVSCASLLLRFLCLVLATSKVLGLEVAIPGNLKLVTWMNFLGQRVNSMLGCSLWLRLTLFFFALASLAVLLHYWHSTFASCSSAAGEDVRHDLLMGASCIGGSGGAGWCSQQQKGRKT
ncbi:hypothetical protein ACQ4PT_051413 [Festuca glaucescens]